MSQKFHLYPLYNNANNNNNEDADNSLLDSDINNSYGSSDINSINQLNDINSTNITNDESHIENIHHPNNSNFKFFPYSNNKMIRSTGTLDLSLSMMNFHERTHNNNNNSNNNNNNNNSNNSNDSNNNNNGCKHDSQSNIDQHGQRDYAPYTQWPITSDQHPITPKLKRTASNLHLSPIINDPQHALTNWKYSKSNSNSQIKDTKNKKIEGLLKKPLTSHLLPANDIFPYKKNVPSTEMKNSLSVFDHNTGLQSKLSNKDTIRTNRNKKSMIPNTPIKKNPLKDVKSIFSPNFDENNVSPNFKNRRGSNNMTLYNDDINGINNNLTFTRSPSILTPQLKLPSLSESPRSISPFRNSDMLFFNSLQDHNVNATQYHHNNNKRLKKFKKSRESVIFKNVELTNSLQQFTDDLYGTEDNIDLMKNNGKYSPSKDKEIAVLPENMLSFFHKFPPPVKLPTRVKNTISPVRTIDSNTNSPEDQYLSTPTRKNFLHNKQSSNETNNLQASHSQLSPPRIEIDSAETSNNDLHRNATNMSLNKQRHINACIKNRAVLLSAPINPDSHLYEQFNNVHVIGEGQFSKVYQVTLPDTGRKYAVKSVIPNKHNPKARIIQEISLLAEISSTTSEDREGKEYVINFISSWIEMDAFYIMTDYYENGNLDNFLEEHIISKKKRLEDWRIWKIIVELSLALRFIHDSCHIVHLDIKPANIMITFEGNLKLADFGMATRLPLEDLGFENEGDREYIAPEIISDCIYDFRADIFSLGLMIVEIAANVVLPDNGNAWHKLRSGDLSDAGRLSSNEIHSESLFSTASTKVDNKFSDYTQYLNENATQVNDANSTTITNNIDIDKFAKNKSDVPLRVPSPISKIPAWVPKFLIDGKSLEKMVKWMIEPDYRKRPTASQILETEECQYVEATRRAGAIIQEDDFGPKPDFFGQ
ncbi:hypothetical protein RI543_000153 [Arxiozyma heterogenica]|uniref:Protein kinase domain-containing protein n=1 Tax=Arxiozyma heterogenica TaxID=278026 RepID=A0AAN7WQ70_9SACH|nr:hypothetical protein RI543_000153 [Kazachstania heterogenica]